MMDQAQRLRTILQGNNAQQSEKSLRLLELSQSPAAKVVLAKPM